VLLFFMIMLPFFLGVDGTLSRIDGVALIFAYLGYATWLWVRERKTGHLRKNVNVKFLWKDGLTFLLALAALFLSSRFLVFSSIEVSTAFQIPTYVMAIVVLGIAASLPDLLVGIRSILQGEVGVGVGNALGSMIVKALFFFGIFALINPLTVDLNLIKVAIVVTIISLAFVMYLTEKEKMTWKHGIILILIYIGYLVIESLRGGM